MYNEFTGQFTKESVHKINKCKECFYASDHGLKRELDEHGKWQTHHTNKCHWVIQRVKNIYWCNKYNARQTSLFE